MSVADLLKLHPYLSLQPSNRILCAITMHEMPPDAKCIVAHINGKKFKKALEWYSYDYSQFEPHIIGHNRDEKKLFCVLTKQTLNKIPEEVQKHVSGKRFLRLKAEADTLSAGKKKHVTAIDDYKNVKEEDEEEEFWKPDFSSDEEDVEELSTHKKKRKPSVVDDDSKDENSEDEEGEEDDNDESIPAEVPVSQKKRKFDKKKQFGKIKPSKISKTTVSNKVSKSQQKEFDDENFIIRKMRGGMKSNRYDK